MLTTSETSGLISAVVSSGSLLVATQANLVKGWIEKAGHRKVGYWLAGLQIPAQIYLHITGWSFNAEFHFLAVHHDWLFSTIAYVTTTTSAIAWPIKGNDKKLSPLDLGLLGYKFRL